MVSPVDFIGIDNAAMRGLGVSPGKEAFIARAVAAAQRTHDSERAAAEPAAAIDHYPIHGQEGFGAACNDLAAASSLHGLLATALGAKPAEPKVHIDVSAKLADINLSGLEFEVMPDGAAVDDFASKVAASKRKGIANPFPYVDLHDFLPHWARAEGATVFNEEGDQLVTKRSKLTSLTWPQWQAAYGRFAIASAVVGVWTYRTALAHREVVLQVCICVSQLSVSSVRVRAFVSRAGCFQSWCQQAWPAFGAHLRPPRKDRIQTQGIQLP